MKAKIAIVSLRFNPAFIQHGIAYAKALRELGHEPEFLVDPAYKTFPEIGAAGHVRVLDSELRSVAWTHAVFLNPAVQNRDLAVALKKNGTRIVYVYHEPWQMSLSYLWSEGLAATVKASMAHWVTVPTIRLADIVILGSRYGLAAYQKWDSRYNRNSVCFPLIYDDEAPSDILGLLPQKRYFAFIGNLCRAHGFDQYLSFMRHALARGMDIRFLIASRNPIPNDLLKESLIQTNLDRIEIRCGRALDSEEINLCYAESFCVWNLYRRSTQSGVLPKAFMFGTAVIANKIGSFPEYIQQGVNGRFAKAENHQEIVDGLQDIRRNITSYAVNCRRSFHSNFFYRSLLLDLRRILV